MSFRFVVELSVSFVQLLQKGVQPFFLMKIEVKTAAVLLDFCSLLGGGFLVQVCRDLEFHNPDSGIWQAHNRKSKIMG